MSYKPNLMSFVIPPPLQARLMAAATMAGVSASEIIRTGISVMVEKIEKDGNPAERMEQ